MADSYFINPFLNPIFFKTIFYAFVFLCISFGILSLLFKGDLVELKKSNIGQRFIGWCILIPIYLLTIFIGGMPALTLFSIGTIFALKEAMVLTKLPSSYFCPLSLLAIFGYLLTSYYPSQNSVLPILFFLILSSFSIFQNNKKEGFLHMTTAYFISVWIIFCLSQYILLGHLNNTLDSTKSLLILAITMTSLSDIGAYIFGKFFQKFNILSNYKVADQISPNKTYIGIVGHIVGAYLGVLLVGYAVYHYLSWYLWVLLSILVGINGFLGGMTNSLVKRYFNQKNSSELIPGHGGILDRIDSLSRSLVVMYVFFKTFL